MKMEDLAKRKLAEAEADLAKAKAAGDAKRIDYMEHVVEETRQLHELFSGDFGRMCDDMNELKERGL